MASAVSSCGKETNPASSPADPHGQLDLRLDLDRDAGDLPVALGAVGVAERQQRAGHVDWQAQRGAGGERRLVDVAQVFRRLREPQAPLPAGRHPDGAEEQPQRQRHRAAADREPRQPVAG